MCTFSGGGRTGMHFECRQIHRLAARKKTVAILAIGDEAGAIVLMSSHIGRYVRGNRVTREAMASD